MTELMQLLVGWALIGAFAVTVLITCLSFVDRMSVVDKDKRGRLYNALAVEFVLGLGLELMGMASFDPGVVSDRIRTRGANAAVVEVLEDLTECGRRHPPELTREQAVKVLKHLGAYQREDLEKARVALILHVQDLPPGPISRDAIRTLRPMIRPLARGSG